MRAICTPARMVSGDYYDYELIHGTQVALTIADVAGKGISAALLMASLQSSLRQSIGGPAGSSRGGGAMGRQPIAFHLQAGIPVESPASRQHIARKIRDLLPGRLRRAVVGVHLH